ncbi:cation-translocating P-type ATPase [Roseimicrobium sp. ORNL1]|nr:cation-translocating P-type ATPase [Roseimicrobium sp. ORNL1]
MEGMAAFLAQDDEILAMRLDPAGQTISVATKGIVNAAKLKDKLDTLIRELDEQFLSTRPAAQGASDAALVIERPHVSSAAERKAWTWRQFAWPTVRDAELDQASEWKRLALQAGMCLVLLLAGVILERHEPLKWLAIACYTGSMIAGGINTAVETWAKLKNLRLDIDFLMLAVALAASSIGAWREGALLLCLFSTSGAIEHYVLHRTRREISALTRAAPKVARVIAADGSLQMRPVESLVIGDQLRVLPDELIPVDGTLISGETAVDESNVTGESVPIEKASGDTLLGGTLNLWGSIALRVEKVSAESTLQRIIALIEQAEHLRAPSQRFTDKFGTTYTLSAIGLTIGMFFVWWLVVGIQPFENLPGTTSAFYRSMTLLVVMSPCALALSIPSAILAAIAWGARHGLLFRGGAAVEKLAEVDVICMDKTGTLTEGAMRVRQVESFPAGHEIEVARIAVSLDSHSNHPISRAISEYGRRHELKPETVTDFQRISGMGLRGKIHDVVYYVGRRELLSQPQFREWLQKVPDTPLAFSEVWVLGQGVVGRILLEDSIREGSRSVLKRLKEHGIETMMLTGDRRAAAESVAKELGVASVRAGLHPGDKVNIIQELTSKGRKVAMVGDGVNDAPSLAAAHVSVAMGARGSDAAMEQSDIVLMNDRIEKLLTALELSQRARRIIRQNLAIALGAIALASLASLASLLPLAWGVVAHEGSTLIVCLNSLRLIFHKDTAAK